MPSLLTRPLTAPPDGEARADASGAEDRFIRVGDVLHVTQGHPPSRFGPYYKTERTSVDDCRVVRTGNIRPFSVEGASQWVSYEDVARRFTEMDSEPSKQRPYSWEQVFAPLKLVLAESERPVRAALVYEPVYPWQAKIATPLDGALVPFAYAACAIINSPIGHYYYHLAKAKQAHRSEKPHNLDVRAVRLIPIARRSFEPKDLDEVAFLAHQLTTLFEAHHDLVSLSWGFHEFRGRVREQLSAVEHRLGARIPYLLGLTDEEETAIAAAADSDEGSGQRDFFAGIEGDLLLRGEPPARGPIVLLTDDELELLDHTSGRPAAVAEHQRTALQVVRHWEEAANQRPPRYVESIRLELAE